MAGCASKLDRATEHYKQLIEEHEAWIGSEPMHFDGHFEAEGGWWVFTARCAPISLRYSNIIGDIVHNLRCVLDHLVCQLAVVNGGTVTHRHQFPIITDRERGPKMFDGAVTNNLVDVAPEHVETIRACQPFLAPEGATSALAVLSELSNRDKHRLINAVTLVAGPGVVNFGSNAAAGPLGEIRQRSTGTLANGDEFVRVKIEPVGPEPEVWILDARFNGEILLADLALPAISTMRSLAQQVARILDQFEPQSATSDQSA